MIPEPRHPCYRTCSSRKSLALFQVASTWATQVIQELNKMRVTTGTDIHPICIRLIRHPWMRPAGPMGVGNLGDRLPMDEDGCPTRTCCCLSVSSLATFPKSTVSMHRGGIKLKGSGSVSLFPDCQELSSRKDDVRQDPPLMFWGTVRCKMAEAFEHPKHILFDSVVHLWRSHIIFPTMRSWLVTARIVYQKRSWLFLIHLIIAEKSCSWNVKILVLHDVSWLTNGMCVCVLVFQPTAFSSGKQMAKCRPCN